MLYSFQSKSIYVDVGNRPSSSTLSLTLPSIPLEETPGRKRPFTLWLMSVQTAGFIQGTHRSRKKKIYSLKTNWNGLFFLPLCRWPYFIVYRERTMFFFFSSSPYWKKKESKAAAVRFRVQSCLNFLYPPHLPFYLFSSFSLLCLRAWVRAVCTVVPYCSMLMWPSACYFFLACVTDWLLQRDAHE